MALDKRQLGGPLRLSDGIGIDTRHAPNQQSVAVLGRHSSPSSAIMVDPQY